MIKDAADNPNKSRYEIMKESNKEERLKYKFRKIKNIRIYIVTIECCYTDKISKPLQISIILFLMKLLRDKNIVQQLVCHRLSFSRSIIF